MVTTVTGLTAEQMLKIAGETIVAARIQEEDLILTTRLGNDINVGKIKMSESEVSHLVATVVPGAVAESLAAEDVVAQVTQAAVTSEIDTRGLITASDPRIVKIISSEKWLWALANTDDNAEAGLDTKARFWSAGGMHPDMGLPYMDQDVIFDYAAMLALGQVPFGIWGGNTFISQLHEKSPIRARRLDIRRYLENGEALPNDGQHDAQPVFQRAFEDAYTQVAFGHVQVWAPEGRYRLLRDIDVMGKSFVGFAGETRAGTVLLPEGTSSAFRARIASGYIGPDHEGMLFSDFTIDGINQGGEGSFTNVKGIYIQRLIKSRFENITIINVAATGFGVDFLNDVWVINCHAENCGRLIAGDSSTGAGFGFATGLLPVESVRMMNCTSKNNRSHGVFLERSASRLADLPGAPNGYRSMGFVMIGCWLEGNYDGYFGSGGFSALIKGNVFYKNRYAGVFLDENTTTLIADDLAQIKDNIIWGNGWDVTTAGANADNRSGIRIRGTKIGMPPVIDGNIIAYNDGWGIKLTDALPGEGLRITSNQIFENWYSGVSMTSGTGPHRCRIESNDVWNNGRGQTGVEGEEDGIVISKRLMHRARINDNIIWDRRSTGKTQKRGLVIDSIGETNDANLLVWDRPRIRDNDLDGNLVTGFVERLHASVNRSFIAGNITS